MNANQLVPHDHPSENRPHRIYFALTNHCNRACPWCSTCSSPAGSTFLSLQEFLAKFPQQGEFEVQLEGGEPTTHPQFEDFVQLVRENDRVTRLVLCTNGVLLPRESVSLDNWLDQFGPNFTLKLSINHYLLARDPGLIQLAQSLSYLLAQRSQTFIVNVRLRRGYDNDDAPIKQAVQDAGLLEFANVFYLQRYGFASQESEWDEPFLAGHNFSMINPDGKNMGTDLIARSEAMRLLP